MTKEKQIEELRNEMEYVFDETLEKINEITDECYEEVE